MNGVVFTGGNIRVLKSNGKPTPIYLAFKHITEFILKKNQNSNYYPLWGTCMGFWNIARILGQNMTVLSTCENCIYVKRNVYPGTAYKGRMLKNLSQDLRTNIQTDKINVFLHKDLIAPRIFQKGTTLSKYWTPVAYSYDAAGKKYVSMAESPRYPIYGTQFHPEKPEFENKKNYNIPHTKDAIRFGRYLANFFVSEARKNSNTFPNSESYVIDNYSPRAAPSSAYEQVYYFKRQKA